MPELKFTEAILDAQRIAMAADERVHLLGLGATYKNGCDGTSGDLAEVFPHRVHDTPCSEAATTGMCVGMAVSGLRPIIHHGRPEFAFLASDSIITQAAKWDFMFGGSYPCPMVVRIAVGRHHGHGPQHTQVPRGMYAIPGLKVVVPASPFMAKALLLAAVEDDDPVIYLEHRWLYKLKGECLEGREAVALSKARVLRKGSAVTIVAVADMVLESLRAAKRLQEAGIDAEVIDLVSLNPIDYETILSSVRKTRRLVIADVSTPAFSVGHELIGELSRALWNELASPPEVVTCPNAPCPTAPSLTEGYYPTDDDVINAVILATGAKNHNLYAKPRTFKQLHLPPTDNISELIG